MHNQTRIKQPKIVYIILLVSLVLFVYRVSNSWTRSDTVTASARSPTRRVNMPYLGAGPPVELFEPAIFWFGQVDPTSNYADVRMWYYDGYMKVFVNIIDRLLWYDENPTSRELSEWDAVSLYLNLDANQGALPGLNSYHLVGQLNPNYPQPDWQAAFRGNGTSWESNSMSFTTSREFRGNFNNDLNDSGWGLAVIIPFASLGLSGPPPNGTIWGLGVSLHDRDSISGSPTISDQVWPEQMDPVNPSTWGQLHFGRSTFETPELLPIGSLMVQQGLNGAVVPDAHVGGNFTCANGVDHWSEWGETNYAGSTQINIQNQWDISDYSCFSKFYITFPLSSVPNEKAIVSATLYATRFGNSGGGKWGEPPDSYIHALTVGEDWNEATLNWNNAPLPIENISGAWVQPVQTSEQELYSWDVTKAVTEAKESGEPLRLALYSIDGDRHSGKYFWSSDSNDWGGTVRPRLEVIWGTFCGIQDQTCEYNFIPLIAQ